MNSTTHEEGTTETVDVDTVAAAFYDVLERAWNAADGTAYGAAFTELADFVDIRGTHHHGPGAAIGAGHQAIFDSIYRGSTIRYRLQDARELAPGVVLAHAVATLDNPDGPLQGISNAVSTTVLARTPAGWWATAFHNTVVTG